MEGFRERWRDRDMEDGIGRVNKQCCLIITAVITCPVLRMRRMKKMR